MRKFNVKVNGKSYEVEIEEQGVSSYPSEMKAIVKDKKATSSSSSGSSSVKAPLQGIVIGIAVKEGDSVKQGDVLLKIEAMKMENEVPSPVSGTVKKIHVNDGDHVKSDDLLIDIE